MVVVVVLVVVVAVVVVVIVVLVVVVLVVEMSQNEKKPLAFSNMFRFISAHSVEDGAQMLLDP